MSATVVATPSATVVATSSAASSIASAAWYSPPWPANVEGKTLTLTWYVRAASAGAGGEEQHAVELVAKLGATERRLSLPERPGALFPADQGVCRAQPAGEARVGPLAEITFTASNSSGFLVDRESPTELSVVEVVRADADCKADGRDAAARDGGARDGARDGGARDGARDACVRETRRLGVMPVPRDIATVERLVLVEGPTRESTYRCE